MAGKAQPGRTIAQVRKSLRHFLENNPEADVGMSDGTLKIPLVVTPWGDPSMIFRTPDDDVSYKKLVAALNKLRLPPRLSAIYHLKTKRLEIIFTARALSANLAELDGRAFEFNYKGDIYPCKFDSSSAELLTLADCALYPQNSDTRHRNLKSFSDFIDQPTGKTAYEDHIRSQFGRPLSFFVDNVEWDDEGTISLLRHISFYLRYYDALSPFILFHPPDDSMSVNPKVRYAHGAFPGRIATRELNPTLLSFWLAAADAAPENKFLYCYRIIEFVSSNYLKNDKLVQVKRVLSNPALQSSLDTSIDALIGLIREEKPDNVNRFKSVVSDLAKREFCMVRNLYQFSIFHPASNIRWRVRASQAR